MRDGRRHWRQLGIPVVAVIATGCAIASGAPASRSANPKLPAAQLVAIARQMLRGLDNAGVNTASVIPTTLNAAENATYPGSEPLDPKNPRAYLIMLRGRFICTACSTPAGAKAPRGRFAYSIWIPGRGSPAGGLQPRTPRQLQTLGPIISLPLIPPQIPTSELVLHSGSGLGPVRLGALLRTIDRSIGPAISPGQWVDGPIEIDTQSDHRGRVSRLVVLSAEATIDGHPISDGYTKLRHELGGWRALRCHGGTRILLDENTHGVSTRLEFTGHQFIGAFIEPVPSSTCLAPLPAG
jgi:hypothetical protein